MSKYTGLTLAGDIMREFRCTEQTQIEFLRNHKIKCAQARPFGRGFSLYVTELDAGRLRFKLQAEKDAKLAARIKPEVPLRLAEVVISDSIKLSEATSATSSEEVREAWGTALSLNPYVKGAAPAPSVPDWKLEPVADTTILLVRSDLAILQEAVDAAATQQAALALQISAFFAATLTSVTTLDKRVTQLLAALGETA